MSRRGENIYKRKDGRWEGRYIKSRTTSGKIKYGYIYDKTYREVKKKLYEKQVAYQHMRKITSTKMMSLQQWGQQCIAKLKNELSIATQSSYIYKLEKYIYPFLGWIPLNEITKEVGKEFVDYLIGLGLSESSVRIIFKLFNRLINLAVKEELLDRNPLTKVNLPKIKKQRVRSLSRKEQLLLEATALETTNPLIIIPLFLSLHAGLRIGEVAALTWDNIDFEKKVIEVTGTLQRIRTNSSHNKTAIIHSKTKSVNSTRMIPMTTEINRLLSKYYKQKESDYVLSKNNKPYEPRNITYSFHKLLKLSGLESIHFHQLRHTFATRCIETNGDISSVSALLGHASTQMTLDIYADTMMEQRSQVILNMEKALSL